jgi:glutathionyl-hydroquinone reductase
MEVMSMITPELTKKIDLLSQESYHKVENFVEQLLSVNVQTQKDSALKTFMEKMTAAEKSVQEQGYFTEEEVEQELEKI